jgi:hypothetical protein
MNNPSGLILSWGPLIVQIVLLSLQIYTYRRLARGIATWVSRMPANADTWSIGRYPSEAGREATRAQRIEERPPIEIRKASRSHAFDSPMPGECKDSTNSPARRRTIRRTLQVLSPPD